MFELKKIKINNRTLEFARNLEIQKLLNYTLLYEFITEIKSFVSNLMQIEMNYLF